MRNPWERNACTVSETRALRRPAPTSKRFGETRRPGSGLPRRTHRALVRPGNDRASTTRLRGRMRPGPCLFTVDGEILNVVARVTHHTKGEGHRSRVRTLSRWTRLRAKSLRQRG